MNKIAACGGAFTAGVNSVLDRLAELMAHGRNSFYDERGRGHAGWPRPDSQQNGHPPHAAVAANAAAGKASKPAASSTRRQLKDFSLIFMVEITSRSTCRDSTRHHHTT